MHMEDDFLNIVNLLQNGQTPPLEPLGEPTVGLQSEERSHDFGAKRLTFGFQSVNESANEGGSTGEK